MFSVHTFAWTNPNTIKDLALMCHVQGLGQAEQQYRCTVIILSSTCTPLQYFVVPSTHTLFELVCRAWAKLNNTNTVHLASCLYSTVQLIPHFAWQFVDHFVRISTVVQL